MNSKEVNLSEIKSNPNNPRIIKDDKFYKLVESIKTFPRMLEIRPIVVNKDMVVLGGNMRLRACKEAGIKKVPVIFADDLTEEQQREFIIKDNVGFGEWDWAMIANEWDTNELTEWGLDIPDFEIKELPEATEDDYEIPDEIQTDIILGDLFEIGEHRLLCGDSTQLNTFEKLFANQMADLVVTDPPYNVSYEGKTKDKLTIKNDSMNGKEFYQFLYDFYIALGIYTKSGGVWYIWQPDKQAHKFIQAFQDAGYKYSGLLIWVKNTLVMSRGDYHAKHESCVYGWKEGAAHAWFSDRKQTTVLNFDRPTRNTEHPTMKPVPLIAYQIKNSSKKGDIVADAFGGSGTTMVASHKINRKCYLVEYDPKYCQVIIDRMRKLDPSLVIKKNGKEI